MQLIREKEKLYFIAKNEAEAVEAEAILTPLLKRFLPDNDAVERREKDLQRFNELTKNFTESVPQSQIDKLADEIDTAMWEDYKAKRNV